MKTTLYFLRHGATEANLVQPYRLQGCGSDGPLAPVGVRQAELTRDALADRRIDFVYSSPMRRARQTAEIIAAPHRLSVEIVPVLTECNVGEWEGRTWEWIREEQKDIYERFMANPAVQGYPGGETFAQVAERVIPAIRGLCEKHTGKNLLVIGHHVVNRVFLADVLGLPPSQARQVKLDNCGISIVVQEKDVLRIERMNETKHLKTMQAM